MTPYREAKFDRYTGAILFEFQPPGMSTDEFCLRLDQFFLMLPRKFQHAVEIRNPDLLGVPFSLMLSRHGVAHVYNHWSGMPPLAEQHTHMHRFHGGVHGTAPPDAVENVLCSREQSSRGCPAERVQTMSP